MSICGWDHQDPCIIVTIGDVEAVSNGPQYGYGLSALIDGWEGGAPATGGPVEFERGDGAVRGDVHYAPRSLIVEGDIRARDHEDLTEKIAALSALGRYETLTVDEAVHTGLVRQVDVARLRPVQVTTDGPEYALWTMTLQTVDWRRVDVDQQSVVVPAGGAGLQNLGTAPAALTLRLVGPLTNPGISWPGGAWQYSGTVASGQTILVDLERRVVRDPATTAHSRRLASGTWLQLPPGTTTVSRTGSGAGSVTASWRSSWA
ncbi:hypothetical protein [Brachybacterium hainanense]|uniref:Phage tail protein n=1 Tax=Brachybacterium hainanense TaxID=1541174 RepID=A0ABV6R986_9MICO